MKGLFFRGKYLYVLFICILFLTLTSYAQNYNVELPKVSIQLIDSISMINLSVQVMASDTKLKYDANVESLLKLRFKLLREISIADPKMFYKFSFQENLLRKLHNIYPGLLEKKITIKGHLIYYYIDDFNGNNTCLRTSLKTDDGNYLSLMNNSTLKAKTNDYISISGYLLGDVLIYEEGTLQILNSTFSQNPKSEQFKVLFLMVTFLDQPPVPYTIDSLSKTIVPINSEMHRVYREMSYNKVDFTAEIYGWYTFQRPGRDPFGNLVPQIAGELEEILNHYNIELEGVDYITWAPFIDGYWPYAGWADLGKQQYIYNGNTYYIGFNTVAALAQPKPTIYLGITEFNQIAIHELGHNMMLMHSDGWENDDTTSYNINYGNKFDFMGWSMWANHFNLLQKNYMGWIDDNQIIDITNSGIYTINALETLEGIKGARIKTSNSIPEVLTIEYRPGIGIDTIMNWSWPSNTEGLFVNTTWPFLGYDSTWTLGTALLDMSDTDSLYVDWNEVTLNGDNIYQVPGRGIRIGPILSKDINSITFRVELDSTFTNLNDIQIANISYKLYQNYPNPFNPNTKISYAIPKYSLVELKVFNLLGQEIATLVNQEKSAGTYEVNFNASNLPSGVYIYKMKAGNFVETKKMILLK